MSIKAINQRPDVQSRKQYSYGQQPSFSGSFNPVVTVMDMIDKGGFAASFIAQDGIGMVAPRIYEGLNRNREKDENGKKTGPLNWEFARREGIREVLSGPSAFLIPLGLLTLIKKFSGTANNVHVSHINLLGQNFADYAVKNPEQLKNAREFKKGYYTQVFKNALSNSTDKQLSAADITKKSQYLANKLIESEELHASKNKKQSKALLEELVKDYTNLRKNTVSSSSDELGVMLSAEGRNKPLITDIKRLTQSLTDYTDDALGKVNKQLVKDSKLNIEQFIKEFNTHRIGTRVLANFGMWSAVVGFYTLIPKLYNIGIKQDPGLKGLENNDGNNVKGKDVAFTGGITSSIGKAAIKEGSLSKLLGNFEFNGASMSVPAMLTLLFGFCLPPRYMNAKSDKERKEILVRDISSFAAILFGAKALSRAFSTGFAKLSGFALNIKPESHEKGVLHKIKNYFTAGHGIEVLSSEQIVTKYSNINEYKEGINGFLKFINENGGDAKKVLKLDKTVKEQTEKIIKDFNGKSLKDATMEEIHKAFEKAKGSEALEKIYTVFSAKDNKFVTRAKTFNSAFGFASTIVLVPAFMMWLARYCEKMTKKAVEKENQIKKAQQIQPKRDVVLSSKPTMAGFIKNNNS